MPWTPLSFSKHKGKTLPQILFVDPDWFFWAIEEGVFEKTPTLKHEASDLYDKARRIRIPDGIEDDPEVEYLIHAPSKKFGTFYIVPADRSLHQGSSPATRKDVIDMSLPRTVAHYDKTGYKLFLRCLKSYIFGKETARVTRQRAERFFDNPSNFA